MDFWNLRMSCSKNASNKCSISGTEEHCQANFLLYSEPARPSAFTIFHHQVLQWSTTTGASQMSLCGGRREQGGLILKLQSSIHPWWLLESPITHQQNMIAQFSSSVESYQYGCGRPQETQPWPFGLNYGKTITPSIQPMFHNKCSSVSWILYILPRKNKKNIPLTMHMLLLSQIPPTPNQPKQNVRI